MSVAVDQELSTINGFDSESDTVSLTDGESEGTLEEYVKSVVTMRSQPLQLPENTSLLECPNGTKVYLIGTAHFSQESSQEVASVISKLRPDFVVMELCANRAPVLVMDEAKIMEDMKNISISGHVKTHGVSHGLLQYLMLRLNAYLTKTLGMAPGGEFRAAANEAAKQAHCHVVLGDRPVGITLQRAFNALGPWSKLRLGFSMLFELEPITKEQVEEMKQRDFLERLLMEMAGDHPELTRILLDERDMYLAKSIWSTTGMATFVPEPDTSSMVTDQAGGEDPPNDNTRLRSLDGDGNAVDKFDSTPSMIRSAVSTKKLQSPCCPYWPSPTVLPRVVVAVVGIGHVTGITRQWKDAGGINQRQLMTLIEPPVSWKLFKWTMKAVVLSTVVLIGYGTVRGSYKLGSTIWGFWK